MSDSQIPDNETPNQRQARLRREKRQAKIAAEGGNRLNKIIGVQGRQVEPDLSNVSEKPASQYPENAAALLQSGPQPASVEDADDPAEMTIAEHFYEPQRTNRVPPNAGSPFGMFGDMSQMQGAGAQGDDPMMAMLQQLMSGGAPGGGPGGVDPMEQMAALAQMFGGDPRQAQQAQAQSMQPATDRTYLWRIVHAVTSLMLATYVILSSNILFTGTKEAREQENLGGSEFGSRLFFWFASTEVVLQSTRYVLERGQLPRSGLMGTAAALLPNPWSGYIKIIGRYSTIFGTVTQDALVILFVLGLVAWWNGQLPA